MATSFEVREVINFLKQRSIITSSEWTEACTNFVKQEYPGQNIPINVLKENVYQQWLNADLEEIGVSALSSELSTTQKVTLSGSFALQVNGVRDVGKPAYAQLKELDRHRSSNDEFSAAAHETSVPQWEAKPTRMLMLNLTDGCTTVQGMEYKPINFLSVSLPPGVKVLVQGPVDCRFGVFLLTPEKIKVLGGEVESKLEQYSHNAILRELLHLPTEDDIPEENNLHTNDVEHANDVHDFDSASAIYGSNNSRRQNLTNSSVTGQQNVNIQTSDNSNSRNSVGNQNRGISNNHQNNYNLQNHVSIQNREIEDDLDNFENEDDDFVQSLDYDAIDELEKEVGMTQVETVNETPEEDNIWNEDEDVLQDMMAFQDDNPEFEIPTPLSDVNQSNNSERESGTQRNLPFTYLSAALEENLSNGLITVKGFIMRILSKLECTADKGWNLSVQINDSTATLVATLHDKVLEGIIGISAVEMVKLQKQAAQDDEKRKQATEAISKCKVTLQNYSCLMDIKFVPGSKPCIVKCYPVSLLHIKQLMERTRSYF